MTSKVTQLRRLLTKRKLTRSSCQDDISLLLTNAAERCKDRKKIHAREYGLYAALTDTTYWITFASSDVSWTQYSHT